MTRWATIPAVLLLGCGQPAAAQELREAEFRDRLAAAVAKATGQPTAIVDEKTFKGKRENGEELTFFIDNAYAEYIADPTRLESILQRFSTELPARDEALATIERLVVIVRPNDYILQSMPAGASLEGFVAARPMAGDLSLYLAVDSPEAIRTVSHDDLKRWGVSEAEAWVRATGNIKTLVGPLSPIRLSDEDGPSGFGAESGLAPSMLADPAICGPGNPDGMNGRTILVIGRDAFIYADAGDRTNVSFWRAVQAETAAGRSLSKTPLTCRGGKWVVATKP